MFRHRGPYETPEGTKKMKNWKVAEGLQSSAAFILSIIFAPFLASYGPLCRTIKFQCQIFFSKYGKR